MHKKFVNLVMMVLMLSSASSVTVLAVGPQDDKATKETEKIKSKVAKIGIGANSKVKVLLKNGERKNGSISEIKSDSFTLMDETTNSLSAISYAQVRQVNKKSSTKGLAIVGIVVGVVSVVALVVAGKN